MSMKKNLLDDEESPSHELTSIQLDEVSEDTRLSPNKHVNEADRTFFHGLPSQVVRTSRGIFSMFSWIITYVTFLSRLLRSLHLFDEMKLSVQEGLR